MGGNSEFFENFESNKYLKKLPSMQRVNLNTCLKLFPAALPIVSSMLRGTMHVFPDVGEHRQSSDSGILQNVRIAEACYPVSN